MSSAFPKALAGLHPWLRSEASDQGPGGSTGLIRLAGDRREAALVTAKPHGHGWFRTSDLSRVKRALSH